MEQYILALDQGTTSTRAMLFNQSGESVGLTQKALDVVYPQKGWVEQDAMTIWQDSLDLCRQVISKQRLGITEIVALGITNQRETTVIWHRSSGQAIYPAIVWQDRRTVNWCNYYREKKPALEEKIQERTGLLLDPYFSASKIAWILDNVPNAREQAEKGELAFGTIDSFLLWHLTGGKIHATDVTNASRTLLFNIHDLTWDKDLLCEFMIPLSLLPEVFPSCYKFGVTLKSLFSQEIPIWAILGDQQAATVGQACFKSGMVKSTYGTGCFVMLNTGEKPVQSSHRLLTTIAYQIEKKPIYALEGSIFMAGAIIQWLRDGLKLIKHSRDSEEIAMSIDSTNGVYLIPAFTGLGAPYWQPQARAAIVGLTRDSGMKEIVRAGLEAVVFQTKDLLEAMQKDVKQPIELLRVDGGMVNNYWMLQFLSDMLDLPVAVAQLNEATVQGVAFIAGLGAGCFNSTEDIEKRWRAKEIFKPQLAKDIKQQWYENWRCAVDHLLQGV